MATPTASSPNTARMMNQSGMDLPFLETASFWSNIAVVALTVLAAIAGVFALYFSSRLGALKDENFARFRLESTEKIAVANSEAAKANEGLARANLEIAQLTAETAKLNTESQALQLEVAKARREAEQDRLERVKLEAQIAPRRLTMDQRKAIGASLKRFAGRKLNLLTYVYDLEGAVLASQIKPALEEAGILVNAKISQVMVIGGFIAGIWVNGPPTEQDLVKALVDSLISDGKLNAANRGANQFGGADPAEGVNIMVGFKPLSPPTSK
jgi:hypothetical protein